jgi:SNF2 family DNA or RNA helicase
MHISSLSFTYFVVFWLNQGLGKTLQVISLIATNSNKPPGSKSSLPASQRFAAAMRGKRLDMAGPTLIVAPLSVIKTWQDQLNQHLAPGSIKVHLHHGVSRAKGGYEAAVNNLRKSDVVLTTFQTVAQEWAGHDEFVKSSSSKSEASAAKPAGKADDTEVSIEDEFENPEDMEAESEEEAAESGPLFGLNWFRIVLDEAHMIRTRTTRQSSAACALRGDRRWCLTGTPVQNKLNDLFSLLCFLRVKPLDELKYWARYVSRPIKAGESAGVMVLRQVLHALCLRRSKDSINPDTGEAIVKLPTKTLNKICVKLSIEERAVYNRVELAGQKAFTNLLQSGSALSNMTSILVMLLRMRQCCNHLALLPASILDDKVALDASTIDPIRETLEQLRDSDGSEVCMVCDEQMKEPMILSGCAHFFCRACIAEFVSHRARQTCCPVCDTPIANNSMIDVAVALAAGNHASNSASSSPNRAELAKAISSQTLAKSKPSSKIVALIQDLRAHRVRFAAEQNLRDDQGRAVLRQGHCKSVVFSQWTSMLDLIQGTLEVEGFKFTRLDGSMTRQKREGAIDAFNNDASVEIMLISLGSGNLGLNLTAANRLYLCDPWWNPQVENQAIDRVHRVGQTRAVDIVRVVVEGTVEDRIFEMQTKKSMILHDVLSGKVSASKDVQKANRIAMLKEMLNVDGQPVGATSSSQSPQSTGANIVRASSPYSSSSQATVSNVKKRPIESAAVDTTRAVQRPKPAAAAASAPPPLLPLLPVQSNFYAPFSLSAPPGALSTVSSNSLQGQMLQQQQLQQVQQQQLKAYMDAQQAAQAAMMLQDDDDE